MGLLGHINTLLDVVTFLLQNMNDIEELPIAADLMIKSFEVHMNTIENKGTTPCNEGKNPVEVLLRVVTFIVEKVLPPKSLDTDILFGLMKDVC